MLFRLRNAVERGIFTMACRGIVSTPPVMASQRRDLTIVTMLSHSDLTMYLIAVKSLCRHLPDAQITVLDDGSLTAADAGALKSQIPGLKLLPISSVVTDGCPAGGCWERLLSVLEFSDSSYVIQMDSDTLTLDAIPEVLVCVRENRSFLLGGEDGQKIVTAEENAELIKGSKSNHLQIAAERALPQLDESFGRMYVRGGAAFTGWARGLFNRALAEKFSGGMQGLLGNRWCEWGSEQVASNYLIANSPGAYVLPYPKYASLWPGVPYERSSFLHCLGTNRFKGGTYRKLASRVIGELRQ